MPSGKPARRNGGFIYIGLLIGLAVIGIGLGAISEVWTQSRQREKEQELLFIGDQFRFAITNFYQQSPAAARRFPLTLDELLEDNRNPDKPARHLRRLYTDPMTQSTRWGEIRLPGGQLVGVYSESSDKPLKTAEFALRNKDFVDKEHYFDWTFRSSLAAANPNLAAGAGYSGNGQPGAPGTQGTPGAPGTAGSGSGSKVPAPAPRPGGIGAPSQGFISPTPRPATPPPGFIQPTPRPR